MRLLRLTNSYDTDPNISAADNKVALVETLLAEALGESVETTVRIIWPEPGLPDLIDKWVGRYQPDLVLLTVSSYWVTHTSVPLRVERSFGPAGKPLARAGLKAAATPWLAHNAVFRGLRRATLRTVGGSTHFTPAQVNASMETCIRRLLAHEGVALAVRGPRVPHAPEGSTKAVALAESRRRQVHDRMKTLTDQLHIPYQGWDTAVPAQERPEEFQGDLVHGNESQHRVLAAEEMELLLRAVRR